MHFETVLTTWEDLSRYTPEELHRTTMELFPRNLPDLNPRQAAGVLYRKEPDRILVRSALPPSKPAHGTRIESTGTAPVPAMDGQVWLKVRLAAETNTMSAPGIIPVGSRTKRRRFAIPRAERRSWALEKIACHGYLLIEQPRISVGEEHYGEGRPPIPWVEVEGPALITDKEKAAAAWKEGIGRGRSYGCGLVLVA